MLTKYVRNNFKYLLKRHSLKYVIWIQDERDNNSDVDYVNEFNLFRTNLFKGIEKKKYNNSNAVNLYRNYRCTPNKRKVRWLFWNDYPV